MLNNKTMVILKKVLSKEVLIYTFAFSFWVRVADHIGSYGTAIHYICSIVFAGYIFNLSLLKSLEECFNVGSIPIISASPKIGSKPVILSIWVILFDLLVFLVSFTCWFMTCAMLNSVVITYAEWLIGTVILGYIALIFISPFLMSRVFCGDETKSDIGKKFRKQFDKRCYLFYIVGLLVFVVVPFTIPETPLKIYMAQGNVVDLTQAREILLTFVSYWIFLMCTCAGLIYAYSSWLSKADLKEVGEYFNLPLKEEDELKTVNDNLG